MPYNDISELPEKIRHVLPKHAQEIYLKSFNAAYEKYTSDETIAYRVAWSAVKKAYAKNSSGKWVKRG